MLEVFASTINDLTNRGLTEESADLYQILLKYAAFSENRARGLLKLTDPSRNPDAGERNLAAKRLLEKLRDKSVSIFTHNELAQFIIDEEYFEFSSPSALGGHLTGEELSILKQLVMQKLDKSNYDSGEKSDTVSEYQYTEDDIVRIIEALMSGSEKGPNTAFFVKYKKDGAYSDALVVGQYGNTIAFLVPTGTHNLGYKMHTAKNLLSLGVNYNRSEKKMYFG